MIHVSEDSRGVLDDLMAAHPFNMSHKADTTVLMLKLRIIQAGGLRRSVRRKVRGRVLITANIFHGSEPYSDVTRRAVTAEFLTRESSGNRH
jgi:hypothetical protein